MSDDAAPAKGSEDLETELRRSRESAAELLENLARRIGTSRAVQKAATGLERAARYVQVYRVRDVTSGLERLVRRRPGYSIAAAVVAGYLVGRALRPR